MSEPAQLAPAAGRPARPHVFGFCQTEARSDGSPTGAGSEWHARCPSALQSQTGLVLCACPAHESDRKCHACQTEVEPSEGYLEAVRQHADPEACQIAADLRHADRRAAQSRMMAAVREDARNLRAQARARTAPTEGAPTVTEPTAARPARTRTAKTPQRCHCGCGGRTKGGRFLTGHDAKLKSALRQADGSGLNLAEQIARGWVPPANSPVWAEENPSALPSVRAAQALLDNRGGPEQYIEARVAARYAEQ